jgi:hypothetical protein
MHIFKTIRSPFHNQDGGAAGGGAAGGDSGLEQPGKTFTQAEVDAMMAKRWKDSELTAAELREMTDMVKQFGYEGTPAEVKAQMKAELEERNKKRELKELEEEAKSKGADPELLKEIKELKKELGEIKKEREDRSKEAEAKKAADDAWLKQVDDFKVKHPDVDMDKLGKNEKFVRFLSRSNPKLALIDVYEDYLELASEAEKSAIEKIKSNDERSTSSGRGKGDADGGTYGLNATQQSIAREGGLSFKEYAERLKPIQNM